jgi:peptidoglycan/LPS O-acetylase OafA/YrhL
MGILRTVLALLVACGHIKPLTGDAFRFLTGGGIFAVKAFFIISGFYMTLIIDSRYKTRPAWLFYASRLTRLLPLYWIVGVMTVTVEWLIVPRGQFFHPNSSPLAYSTGLVPSTLSWPLLVYVALALVTTLGLDTGQWLGFSKVNGNLGIAPSFVPDATSVMALSPIPPGWSIGIELLFYLIAPLVVRRSIGFIVGLAAASIAFRIALARLGFSADPWDRTLFPSELVYFALGILSYRLYRRSINLPEGFCRGLGTAPILFAVVASPLFNGAHRLGIPSLLLSTVPYALVAFGIPYLFRATKDSGIDARIGDLSYPIYIGHLFVFGVLAWLPVDIAAIVGTGWLWVFMELVMVVTFAALLDRSIATPIDKWRQRLGARPRGVPVAAETALRPAHATDAG